MRLCECGCGGEIKTKKWKFLKNHKKEMELKSVSCECGCGQITKLGNRFLRGHKRKQILESILCGCGCGKFTKPGNKFINHHVLKGPLSPFWKGGRQINQGYVIIYVENHPFAYEGCWILEHRYLMEQHIGRYLLEDEVVHHINGIKNDNRIENLQLMSSKDHRSLHTSGENNPMFGHRYSDEWKKERGDSIRGDKNPFYGKHHTEETNKKIGVANSGENSSVLGTIWMSNLKLSKTTLVKKELVDEYLKNGWIKGRDNIKKNKNSGILAFE